MSTRNKRIVSDMIDTPRGNRLATPLSSHRTGARQRIGGDGDGGTAIWKNTATVSSASRRLNGPGRQEKHTIASTLRAASIRSKALGQKAISPPKVRPTSSFNGDKKISEKSNTIPATKQSDRDWTQRKSAGGASMPKRDKLEEVQIEEIKESKSGKRLVDKSVQTDEGEIMNGEPLIGDIKLLMPSAQISNHVDKLRWESQSKLQRESKRKFASYEHNEEQHLDELKEFMERSYVTRRIPKKQPILVNYEPHQYRNVFKYMDECFTREIPKAESITNIQDRIKRKEKELMSMFNDVDVEERSESDSE